MGIFDTIWVKCPVCKTENGFQTKSGMCIMADYELKDAPNDALQNVNRHSPCKCKECGTLYEVDIEDRKAVEI